MAKGKYEEVIKKLPRSFGEEPDYQAKINAVKQELLEGVDTDNTLRLSTDALEDLLLDISAMLQVVNEAMLRPIPRSNRGASTIAKLYRDARMIKAILDKQEKTTNLLIAAFEQIMFEQYEVEGVKSMKLADGDTIRIDQSPHGKIVDKMKLVEWAKKSGLENLLTLPWQTVNALTKEYLLRGEEPPDGVEAESRPKYVYTKG